MVPLLFREKDEKIKEESGENISSSILSSMSNTLNIDGDCQDSRREFENYTFSAVITFYGLQTFFPNLFRMLLKKSSHHQLIVLSVWPNWDSQIRTNFAVFLEHIPYSIGNFCFVSWRRCGVGLTHKANCLRNTDLEPEKFTLENILHRKEVREWTKKLKIQITLIDHGKELMSKLLQKICSNT